MDWSWLLLLICPLMMLFMMKGLHGSHGKDHSQQAKLEDVQQLRNTVEELVNQNRKMKHEIDDLKTKA